jgi:uncharacterized membrane protein YhfC
MASIILHAAGFNLPVVVFRKAMMTKVAGIRMVLRLDLRLRQ